MKVDIYNHEKRYNTWKEQASKKDFIQEGLEEINSKLLIEYIFDMELGINVSSKNKKGGRGYHRLNTLKQKVAQLMKMLQDRGIKDITKITDKELAVFFNDITSGRIKTQRGEKYKSPVDYIKAFKSLWHWHMKVNRSKNIQDITLDLNTSIDDKPVWVYLGNNKTEQVIKKVKNSYKPVLSFMYDSGARVTETFSLVAGDITEENGVIYVNIRNDVSKGGKSGRKIKLLLCGKDIIKYIKDNKLKPEDKLFSVSPFLLNQHLKAISKKLFGDSPSQGGEKFSNLTMYDFRHNSCCFWLPRYKTSSALMYRFGWKSERYIHYYSEFLGLKDNISADDMYVDITKTALEKELAEVKVEIEEYKPLLELVKMLKNKPGMIKKFLDDGSIIARQQYKFENDKVIVK